MSLPLNVLVRVGIHVLTGAVLVVAVRVSVNALARVVVKVMVKIENDNDSKWTKHTATKAKRIYRQEMCKRGRFSSKVLK